MEQTRNLRLYSSEEAEQLKRGPPQLMDDPEDTFDGRFRGPTKKVPLAFEKREFHNFQISPEPERPKESLPLVTIKEPRYLFDKKKALESLYWS